MGRLTGMLASLIVLLFSSKPIKKIDLSLLGSFSPLASPHFIYSYHSHLLSSSFPGNNRRMAVSDGETPERRGLGRGRIAGVAHGSDGADDCSLEERRSGAGAWLAVRHARILAFHAPHWPDPQPRPDGDQIPPQHGA